MWPWLPLEPRARRTERTHIKLYVLRSMDRRMLHAAPRFARGFPRRTSFLEFPLWLEDSQAQPRMAIPCPPWVSMKPLMECSVGVVGGAPRASRYRRARAARPHMYIVARQQAVINPIIRPVIAPPVFITRRT